MKNKLILVGTFVSLAVVIGCGDDDDASDRDAGPDGSVTDSGVSEAGRGGRGGTSGRGGAGGRSGAGGGGRGGAAAGGEGGASGAGSGGAGGSGATTHAVGGEVSGLSGDGLVLQNNGGDDLTVDDAGSFKFDTEVAKGEGYAVTVKTQPSNPTQTCTVSDGTGDVGDEDVTNVAVACATNKFKVGGTISGLTGTGLVLKNNGGDTLNASGASFEFATSLDSGADYAVTVTTQPSDQVCAVASATGKVGAANVTSVAVTCHGKTVLQVEPSFGSAIASWSDTGAASYTVKLTTSATCDLETTSCAGFVEIANATSPTTIPSLTNDTPYYVQVTANYPGGVKSLSNKTATRPNAPHINGNVYAVATAASGVTYIGGAFTQISLHSGGAVPVHKSTGLPSEIPNFPIVDADIYAVALDGSGGYYIGGTFTAIGGVPRGGLAHITSAGLLDPGWDPDVSGGLVRSIVVHNTTVYIAGSFTMVDTAPRAGLAAIGVDGTLSATFNPTVTPAGSVHAITFVGNDVVAGGDFTAIGGGTQANLALLDGTSGLIKTWNPNADGTVNVLAANGDIVYVGGEFANIGSAARRAVAALNGTGAMAAQATTWDPSPDNAVTQIAFANNTVYIAGTFTNVGSTARAGIAAIDAAGVGALKEWNPAITPANSVSTLAASADTVYLGGSFTSVGSMPRNGTAAVSGSGTGALADWNPNPDGVVEGFALSGDSVVVIGQYQGIRTLARPRAAAFAATGGATAWNPDANGDVYALATSGTQVYIGGAFTTLGGMARNHIGAVAENGTLDATFNPNANVNVNAFAVSGTTLYVGGGFTTIGTQPRFSLAALDATTGVATAWNPGANNSVRALSLQGTTLYVGGDFTTFGSLATRNHIASILTTSDTATGWDPNIAGTSVNALASTATTVYAGGDFTAIGGMTRNFLGAIDATTGAPTAFDPAPTGIVHALLLDDGKLYVGGEFLNISTEPLNHYAGYDNLGVLRADYLYDFNFSVRALSLGASAIYVGGDFQALNGVYANSFASVPK
jgi:hypothetical protein